jgi:hypothetical protein
MYSGSTLTTYSGRLLGAHQKIDRSARRQLEKLMPHSGFPKIRAILHFEGGNGPDSIKRKSPAKDEPWHYMQPYDYDDNQLLVLITAHYQALVTALRRSDTVKAAFEAAWLAHAIVDGLTPAHHFPYEEKLSELREGRDKASRTTVKAKLIMPGETISKAVKNNWRMWGPKGLFTTHSTFELGVAMLIAPMHLSRLKPKINAHTEFNEQTLPDWFRTQAQQVADLHLYDNFYKTGWTIPLARQVRKQLARKLVQSVALVWYNAEREAIALESGKV